MKLALENFFGSIGTTYAGAGVALLTLDNYVHANAAPATGLQWVSWVAGLMFAIGAAFSK